MSSHRTASCSARCRASSPPLKWVSGHSLTMCCMDSGSPQLQFGLVAWPHRTRLTAHRPCPVRNRFSIDQCRRGRSKPGGQTDGSATREWFTTSVAAHSSLHAELAVISSGSGSSQTGFLDDRRAAGCSVNIRLDFSQQLGSGLLSSEMWWWNVAENWQPW